MRSLLNQYWVLLLALAFLPESVVAQESNLKVQLPWLDDKVNRDFAESDFWDDGKAEVAVYDANRIIYGNNRPHTTRLITVSEDFNKEYYVKADWPYGQKPLLTVLKQNMNATIQTPNYPYHFMRSYFIDRFDFGTPVKMSISSQEWCGTTYKEFHLWKDQPDISYHSYWDGQGTGEFKIPSDENYHFEEELYLLLRGLKFEDSLVVRFFLAENQISSKASEPEYSLSFAEVKEQSSSWQVTVESKDGRELKYEFSKTYPHVLLSFEHSDGRSMELKNVERWAYWVIEE